MTKEGIKNFWMHDIQAFSLDLSKFEDEDETVYNPTLILHLKVTEENNELKTEELIMFQTDIWNECPHCALKEAFIHASSLLKTESFYSSVTVFDEDGNQIDQLNLAEILNGEETSQTIPGKEEYDLANMLVGVPVIKH